MRHHTTRITRAACAGLAALLLLATLLVSAPVTALAAAPGTIIAWGNNNSGQSTVPSGLSGVTAIAAGAYYSVALKHDGIVVAWGQNDDGQAAYPPASTV